MIRARKNRNFIVDFISKIFFLNNVLLKFPFEIRKSNEMLELF